MSLLKYTKEATERMGDELIAQLRAEWVKQDFRASNHLVSSLKKEIRQYKGTMNLKVRATDYHGITESGITRGATQRGDEGKVGRIAAWINNKNSLRPIKNKRIAKITDRGERIYKLAHLIKAKIDEQGIDIQPTNRRKSETKVLESVIKQYDTIIQEAARKDIEELLEQNIQR